VVDLPGVALFADHDSIILSRLAEMSWIGQMLPLSHQNAAGMGKVPFEGS
jgi:hypothetical protein